jgi:carboxyl-terminal processing protease
MTAKRVKKIKTSAQLEKVHKFKNHMTTNFWFIIVAIVAALGFLAGTYHYQIWAFIGPVFGNNSYSANINLTSVEETYNVLMSKYDGKLDVNTLIEGANRGLVDAAGDPYTVYMSPQESNSYSNTLSGNIGGGIGAVIGIKNSMITIMSVLDNNAAKSAGLVANDVILKINDESIDGWTVERSVSLIRGEPGTTVKLNIQRSDVIKDYTVTRAVVNNPSVISSVSDGVGKITISRFDEETGNLARIAAQDFIKQNVKSVILDLRDNPGGYVNSAKEVASLWLDNKLIVTERSGDTVKDTITSGSNALLAGIPTVIIVNGQSASSSEIVAGALQDHKAAILVGEKTYGKGCVQQLVALGGGGELKVTTARWYTPNGKNITEEGIMPDVTASLTQKDIDEGVDPQLDAAMKQLGL